MVTKPVDKRLRYQQTYLFNDPVQQPMELGHTPTIDNLHVFRTQLLLFDFDCLGKVAQVTHAPRYFGWACRWITLEARPATPREYRDLYGFNGVERGRF